MNSEVFLFTVIGIIMANSFLLMAYTWKLLTSLYLRLPVQLRFAQRQNIIFRNRRNLPKAIQARADILMALWSACVFLGISIFFNALALIGISTQIYNLHIGPFTEANYNEGKFMLVIAIVFFVSGIFCTGMARICQFIVFTMNEHYSIFTLDE
jgi:hypothetical protein